MIISVVLKIFCFDVLCILIVLHRFYGLTDFLKLRNESISTKAYSDRILNDQIIYKNSSVFLQRKHIVRQAAAMQTFSVIKKKEICDSKHVAFDPETEEAETVAARDILMCKLR